MDAITITAAEALEISRKNRNRSQKAVLRKLDRQIRRASNRGLDVLCTHTKEPLSRESIATLNAAGYDVSDYSMAHKPYYHIAWYRPCTK